MSPAIDAERVIADLRELQRRTGDADGAQRLCWGEGWRQAREFLDRARHLAMVLGNDEPRGLTEVFRLLPEVPGATDEHFEFGDGGLGAGGLEGGG